MKKRRKYIAAAMVLMCGILFGCTAKQTASLNKVGLEKAKSAALQDAGIADERIVFTTSQLEVKNGKEYYDIVFFADGYRYEYDIDAFTGIIIEAVKPEIEIDEESTFTQEDMEEIQQQIWEEYTKQQELLAEIEAEQQELEEEWKKLEEARENSAAVAESEIIDQNTEELTEQRAKEIALAQVPGATLENIHEFEADYDDGRIAYEGTIIYGDMEYEFEIDGYSGAIRDWDAESIYD